MSYIVRIVSPQAALACAAIVVLAACQRSEERAEPAAQLAWARAALERNPQIEVVAADPQSGMFTVRDRRTGGVQAVRLDELAAVPLAQLQAQVAPPAAPAVAPETPAAPEPAAEPNAAAATPAEPAQPTKPERAQPAVAGAPNPGYKIERADGQVRVTGPGISVVSSGPAAAPQGAGSQAKADPIICEGPRMVHLDNRSIYVEGNAITARGGCELYITNSHISASGTGIVVEDASVHVANSRIEGADGSFDAADHARLFVRSSTFQGVAKRTQLATVQDQGGNRWQ